MKNIWTLSLVLLLAVCCNEEKTIYKNPDAPIEKRVEDLLRRMTAEEKIWQLTQSRLGGNDNPNNVMRGDEHIPPIVGSMIYTSETAELGNAMQRIAVDSTRLGIPILFGYDAIHGFNSCFPIPLAQAASFNLELAGRANEITAQECREAGVRWNFSPMTDIARDARWGRVMEGYGEDPLLAASFCAATVKAYQGDDPSQPGRIAACLKHYVGYGASEGGRDYAATDISLQSLWDTYLPPFHSGIDAGALTVMSSFNTLNGVPTTASHYLLTEVLRERWGHEGFVVTDWAAVKQLVNQGAADNLKDACRIAFNAGAAMDMCDYVYPKHMQELIDEGAIKMKDMDEAVRRVLRVKFRLGLFEHPYADPSGSEAMSPAAKAELFEDLAQESMVLLKNDGILPLRQGCRITLAGPIADDKDAVLGNWRAHAKTDRSVSILEGMSTEFGSGVRIAKTDAEALSLARSSDVVVLCLGEPSKWSGENKSRASISLPAEQEELFFKLAATGKPIVVTVESGRPLDLSRINEKAAAILYTWCPGHMGGPAVAGLLSGRHNPSGKLPLTFVHDKGQIPLYYNHRNPSRRGDQGIYIDGVPVTPLYDFGYGLSYSKFEYSDLKLDGLTARVSVTNTSDRDGKEVVLWYITDPACSITRPAKELKHFEKRLIKAGQTEEFVFEIDKMRDLGFVDSEGRPFFESGRFILMAGDQMLEFNL
ncbi:MAG: glycoside hydrolase family 3 C-terminal domain-containing protein [Bacteroidales bacterium]|nr:glycoside hydrolase family 3 C-terminal domain-containing protein [Bacteroidales bacterium]